MQAALSTWSQRCDSVLQDLEARAAEVKQAAVQREKLRRKKERAMEVLIQASEEKSSSSSSSQRRGMGGPEEEDMMDIDNEGSSQRVTRGTKRGHGSFGFAGMGKRLG